LPGELQKYLNRHGKLHTRGALYHPMTPRKKAKK